MLDRRHQLSLRIVWVLGLALTGCTPVIPFLVAETAETLPKKGVALTVAAGGGGISKEGGQPTGGADVRVRVGVGHRMEVGVEGAVVGGARNAATVAAKLSYKYAPLEWLAVFAGVGWTGSLGLVQPLPNPSIGIGVDLGVVASTRLLARHFRIYGGPRFSVVMPLSHDVYDAGGPTQALVVPVGVAIELRRGWRLFAEGGVLGVWSENRATQPVLTTNGWLGGYGAFAVGKVWK